MTPNNDFPQLLKHWAAHRDEHDWVLGTVYKTTGPSYRKAGAFMLFNSLGQQFGLLSGGCLESDIQRHAQAVMLSGRPTTLCYDGSDEDDISFQFGIGCGGTVHILLQPITKQNNYLQLELLTANLGAREATVYLQKILGDVAEARLLTTADQQGSEYIQVAKQLKGSKAQLVTVDLSIEAQDTEHEGQAAEYLATMIKPPIHLLVVGGGVDARPLVSIARHLGWEVSLLDPRAANARREHFMDASNVLDCSVTQLASHKLFGSFNAAVLISHNLQIDADALAVLQASSIEYLALLGPESRKAAVIELSGLPLAQHRIPVAGPAGLNLGGELPESLALSILAQCHAVLYGADAQAFSDLRV
ncbi:XdhC family protein [Porticoccaceae bacterium]|nr:XdhC family protein [Porticoccaceae bacterium]